MPQIVRERVQQRSALDGFQRNILGTLCILIVVALYRDEGTTFELQKSVQSGLLPKLTKQTELMNLRGSGEHEVFWQWLQEAFLPVVLVHKDEDHSQGEDLSSWIRTYNQMIVQGVWQFRTLNVRRLDLPLLPFTFPCRVFRCLETGGPHTHTHTLELITQTDGRGNNKTQTNRPPIFLQLA